MTNDNPCMSPALACQQRTKTGHIDTDGNVNKKPPVWTITFHSLSRLQIQMPLEQQFCISTPQGETYPNKSINI